MGDRLGPAVLLRRQSNAASGPFGSTAGVCRSAGVSPACARISWTPSTWPASPSWLAQARASAGPSISSPARSIATACSGLSDERGRNGRSGSPARTRGDPSAPSATACPACTASTTPARSTRASTSAPSSITRGTLPAYPARVSTSATASLHDRTAIATGDGESRLRRRSPRVYGRRRRLEGGRPGRRRRRTRPASGIRRVAVGGLPARGPDGGDRGRDVGYPERRHHRARRPRRRRARTSGRGSSPSGRRGCQYPGCAPGSNPQPSTVP